MEMMTKESVKCVSDHRGFVFEPLEGQCLVRQKNVHVVVSRPGAVRGNHYHRQGTETIVVCGPALVRIRQGGDMEAFTIPAEQMVRLVIPPGISHAIQNVGQADNLLIAFNTQPHEPDHPDTVQEILIPVEADVPSSSG